MRKAIVIVITVAVLGAVSLHNASPANPHLVTSKASANTNQTSSSGATTAAYNNGTFTGSTSDTPYGPVQIAVVISGGKITDVNFLQMPSDLAHSQEVTAFASPLLKQTTLQAQSSNIDFVSGATSTSYGYQASLQSALDKAAQASNTSSTSSSSGSAANSSGGQQPNSGGGNSFDQ